MQRSWFSALKTAFRGGLVTTERSPQTDTLGWFLLPDAELQVGGHVPADRPMLLQHCLDVVHKGYTVVPGALSAGLCDAIWGDFRQHVASTHEEALFRDDKGLHSRLCNFHMTSERMREAAFAPRVTEILDCLFGTEACIYSSLTFEKSSQQFTHRDCPFFYTQPQDLFFGVWFALEDVMPDAGPLFYYEGGHKIPIDEKAIGRRNAAAEKDPLGACFDEYTKVIHKQCESDLQRRTMCLNKGDAIIWHPRLPHGGSRIERDAATRKSMVFHYIPVHVPLYGIGEFFLPEQHPIKPKIFEYLDHGGRHYIAQGRPHFDVNN